MMKSKVLCLILLCLPALAIYSQADMTIWNTIFKQEDNHYIINMPDGWKKVEITPGSGFDYKFDFSGIGIPAQVGESPLYANFTITHLDGDKRKQALDQVINDFTVFYDRVTEPGYNFDTANATVKTGQSGTFLHTRYYRRSKVSNYSKYYLILYSPKTNETFILALNFQYKDANYDIERSAHFSDYAMQVFGHFELR